MSATPFDLSGLPQQADELPIVQPLPAQTALAQVMLPDGKLAVALTILTPYGTQSVVFDGSSAQNIGGQLKKLGSSCASGLIVPPTTGS